MGNACTVTVVALPIGEVYSGGGISVSGIKSFPSQVRMLGGGIAQFTATGSTIGGKECVSIWLILNACYYMSRKNTVKTKAHQNLRRNGRSSALRKMENPVV